MAHHSNPARNPHRLVVSEPLESRVLLSTAYIVSDLGDMQGVGINDSNQVAGFITAPDSSYRPALWSNGKLIEFGPPSRRAGGSHQ